MESVTSTKDQGDCGMWTPAFEQLHAAATGGARTEEIQRLEAAELDEIEAGEWQ